MEEKTRAEEDEQRTREYVGPQKSVFICTKKRAFLTFTWNVKSGIFSWSNNITVFIAPVVESMWK